jgi:hypothetical protein
MRSFLDEMQRSTLEDHHQPARAMTSNVDLADTDRAALFGQYNSGILAFRAKRKGSCARCQATANNPWGLRLVDLPAEAREVVRYELLQVRVDQVAGSS